MMENFESRIEDETKQVFADSSRKRLEGTKCIIGRIKSNAYGGFRSQWGNSVQGEPLLGKTVDANNLHMLKKKKN